MLGKDTNLPAHLNAFDFNGLPIRVVMLDDQPHFIASDVCKCLDITNHRDAVARLKNNEKGVVLTDTLGGTQETLAVNEPGLYRLIFRSNKPEAEPFQDWVYHQVLPAIRATGSYTAPSANTPANIDIAALVQQEVAKQLQQQRQPLQHAPQPSKVTPEFFDEFMQQNVTLNTEYEKKALYDALLSYLHEIGQTPRIRQRTATQWAMSYALQNDYTYIARRSNGRDYFKIESNSPQTCFNLEG